MTEREQHLQFQVDPALHKAVEILLQAYPDTQAILLFATYKTVYQTEGRDVDLALLLPHAQARFAGNLATSDCALALADCLGRDMLHFNDVLFKEG